MAILNTLPEPYYAALNPKTVNDALNSITPAMAVIKKRYGEQFLFAFLTIAIVDLIEFFNVGKTMGEAQVVSTIRLLVDDFYYLNVEDFKLCFNNAKRGKYGKVYDRIDGNTIYEWLNKYSTERVEVAYPEIANQPRQDDSFVRMSNSRNDSFEKFRLSYLVKKLNESE